MPSNSSAYLSFQSPRRELRPRGGRDRERRHDGEQDGAAGKRVGAGHRLALSEEVGSHGTVGKCGGIVLPPAAGGEGDAGQAQQRQARRFRHGHDHGELVAAAEGVVDRVAGREAGHAGEAAGERAVVGEDISGVVERGETLLGSPSATVM